MARAIIHPRSAPIDGAHLIPKPAPTAKTEGEEPRA